MSEHRSIKQHYVEVLRLVSTYPTPDPSSDFDPLTAPNHLLAKYGLPERPGAESEPETFAFWEEMLRPTTQVVQPIFPAISEEDPPLLPYRHEQRPLLRSGFNHAENSRNWSGAYITPIRPTRLLQMAGKWTVADPKAPRIAPSGVDRNNADYRSSTWIGIGGHRSYNSLPQIGTLQNVKLDKGRPTIDIAAWWQWWVKDNPAHHVPIPILNFPVQANDEIFAMLTVEAPWPGDVRFNLKNRRTGRFVAFKVRAPARIRPLGATAEWIHERPAAFNSRDRFPMPDCGEVVFSRCLAWSAPELGSPMTLQRLDKLARLIRMGDMFDARHRSALISIPKKATRLNIRYHEPGRP
jgi:hypothetical protein